MQNVNKHRGILTLLVPQVIETVMQDCGLSESDATERFLNSQVYALLENPETALWHLSPKSLSMMFAEEMATGTITFPEEV